jgi:hypothetical protein
MGRDRRWGCSDLEIKQVTKCMDHQLIVMLLCTQGRLRTKSRKKVHLLICEKKRREIPV